MVPTPTANRWRIVSLRDGRRLRWDGAALDLAPPGTTGPALEWTYAHDSNGYFFIDHPATTRRLRLERVDDANGAPTSITYLMETSGTVRDSVRWRFIKPFQPGEVAPPPALPILSATAGTNGVTLSWPAILPSDFLHYTVYRGTAAGGPYLPLATGITNAGYLDTSATPGTTHYYIVTTTDWLESESAASREASATPLPPPGTYASWIISAFAAAPNAATSFNADPDEDGLQNGLEYGFLTDPLAPTVSPFAASSDAGGKILLHYVRNRSATDLRFTVQGTTNLASPTWQLVVIEFVSQTPDGSVDRVTVRPVNVASPLQFYRLRVQLLSSP